ncbi:hypothetical protein [Zavarzinella formosa]|uniref:hypothetical protein n=1 Tax=Zavarzinella formosa TaxID=360055 RepID=UPI0002FB807A|nr:hypothetical protein [Zavarzinella formosa]
MIRTIFSAVIALGFTLLFCPPSLATLQGDDSAVVAGAVAFEITKVIVLFFLIRFVIGLFVSTPQN